MEEGWMKREVEDVEGKVETYPGWLKEAAGMEHRHYEPEQIIADALSRIQELIAEKKVLQDELDYYRKLEVGVPMLRIVERYEEKKRGTPMSEKQVGGGAETVAELVQNIYLASTRNSIKRLIEDYVEREVRKEREECAKVAEGTEERRYELEAWNYHEELETMVSIAAEIREREEEL